jgi:hypothetical protein
MKKMQLRYLCIKEKKHGRNKKEESHHIINAGAKQHEPE